MNRHFETLELHKILDLLAAQTNGPDAAQAARELRPQTVLTEVWTDQKYIVGSAPCASRCIPVASGVVGRRRTITEYPHCRGLAEPLRRCHLLFG